MLEFVFIYFYMFLGCRISSRSCSSFRLLGRIFFLGGYLKIFVYILNFLVWFVVNGCLSSFLIILFEFL